MNFILLSALKGRSDLSSKNMSNSIKKHPDVYSWRRVGMEWNARTMGAQVVSRWASTLTATVATTSAAHRRTTRYFLVMTNQWKHPWMEWVVSVCPTFIWKQCYLLLIFSWDLLSELRAEPLISVDCRESEPWKKKKRQQKEKQAELRGAGTTLAQNTVVWAKAVWLSPLFLT